MKKSTKIRMIAATIFAAILVLLPISVTAQEIEFNKIEKVALKVFSIKSNRSASKSKISKAIPIYTNNEVAYYIFNFEPSGHIIVSTNKAFEPILGYGLNSTIDFDSIPLGLKFLLDNYKNEISQTKKQGVITSKVTSSKWDNYTNLDINATLQSYSTGTYLLQTTWAQGNGYNRFCPLDPNTNLRTIVGCGGVALGQILYYWQCRVFPDNSITYTPSRFLSPLTVNFFGQNYNWSSMSKTSSDDYNALLLYHSAAAIRADFGSTSTTNYATNTRTAIVTYFGFNANNVQYQNSYTNADWINMLKAEINLERPIYYSGYHYSVDPNESYGHAWVIDGYNSSDLFHCNWGWSGNSNGWYSLSALNPDSYTFNDGQSAILNVYPKLDACSGINGSSDVCTGNYTYSLSIPTSASVVWSKSGNVTQVGGNTGTSYTVNSTTAQSGTGSITATIYNSQNQVFIIRTKDFWVGVPNIPEMGDCNGLTPPGEPLRDCFTLCFNRSFTEDNTRYFHSDQRGNIIEWEWQKVSTNFDWGINGGNEINFRPRNTNSIITFKGRVRNACGWSQWNYFSLGVVSCEDVLYSIYPNPATNILTIELKASETSSDTESLSRTTSTTVEPYTIELWSEHYGLVRTVKSSKSSQQISLKGLPKGMYYVHLISDKKMIKKQTLWIK